MLNKVSYRNFTAVCYILGIVSFEGMTRYNSIKDIDLLIETIYKVRYDKHKYDKRKDKG